MPEPQGFYHYLPVNDEAMRWGAYVTGAGRSTIPENYTKYPSEGHPELYDFPWQRGRVLPEFQLILITDGQGQFESEHTAKEPIPIRPNSLVFLFPGVWHRYRPEKSTGWTERWLSLNGELTHRLCELGVLRPEAAVRPAGNCHLLSRAFDQLLDRIHESPNQNSILLSLRALSLLGSAIEAIDDDLSVGRPAIRSRDIRDPLVADALNLIWTHSHRALSVAQVAKQLSISRRALERHFQDELNQTVLGEINACRLSRAKRLLRETDLGVKAIAALAGFPSEERMRVTFLKSEALSPTDYRQAVAARAKGRDGRPRRRHLPPP